MPPHILLGSLQVPFHIPDGPFAAARLSSRPVDLNRSLVTHPVAAEPPVEWALRVGLGTS